jgi:phosphatidylglycerol:prolipoprotein diacylglycerol transferase
MNPIIEISLGGWDFAISAYRLMLLVAIAVTFMVAVFIAGRAGIPRRAFAWVIAGSAVGAVVGARLMAVLGTQSPNDDLGSRLFRLSAGDFALYGGLIGGGLVGWALCRMVRLRPGRAADSLAPALGAGIFFTRIGCLLTGCCFGNPTHLPWGITYPTGSTPHVHQIFTGDSIFTAISGPAPVHPFPVYDMASALTGALLAVLVVRRGWREGSGMAVFVLWYSTWRLLLYPLRADTGASLLPGWFWPSLFLTATVASAHWLLSNRRVFSHHLQLGMTADA